MAERKRRLARLIETSDNVEFGQYGQGASDDLVRNTENQLGIKLPPSYVWWLQNYGGGTVFGDEIFSIYEQESDEVVGCDIVRMHRINSEKNWFSKDQLVICETDEAVYYFDVSQPDQNGEFPVYEHYSGQKIADDFIEFLIRLIER
ncbi:MAG: SMI1/KNR4 family protein [Candidatus Zixiibacteriota bacterium]